ncbi:MAG TPA: protease modulator HflC [Devosiaceae bacterium]|nr:protease modulator HflC [Devosiaceae bacterium]
MSRTSIIGVLIVVVLGLYTLFSSIFVVNEREQAIVTRFGEIARIEREPGLYFKVPTDIVESVQIIEDRILRFDLDDMTVQVSGGKFYRVDAFLTYRISNPRLFRERVQAQLTAAESRIRTRLDSALRQVYGTRDFNAALSEQRSAMMLEARELIRSDIADLGIDVVDVRIQRTDLTEQVSQQTYDRMTAERLAEAAFLRARGQEAAQTIRAQADRQVVEIRAAAQRDSEILRGEGEGERNRVFAEAFNRDQEFFRFYRSMQAYRAALQDKGTMLVLSPDSDFFRYFGSDSSSLAATPAEAGAAGQ